MLRLRLGFLRFLEELVVCLIDLAANVGHVYVFLVLGLFVEEAGHFENLALHKDQAEQESLVEDAFAARIEEHVEYGIVLLVGLHLLCDAVQENHKLHDDQDRDVDEADFPHAAARQPVLQHEYAEHQERQRA